MLTSFALCRKKKAVHKVSTTDDKRLQATLKRLGVNTIPGIEEVNLFVDNDVIHFTNPKGVHQHMPALYPMPGQQKLICKSLRAAAAELDHV